ncbi:SIMPL domain-containing protein, partial [uncultured Megasphaera sp.]
MKYTSLKGLVVGAMLASSLFAAAPALAANTDASVVTVTGYAQQEVAPDTAYVTIGTTSTDADAQQARTKNNLAMNEVTNALKAMGIPAENLKTTGFYMSPNYDMKGSKITSYTVTNNLEVKLTDLSMVSQVINKAASLGANQVNNVRFTNEHADQIKENLIKEAVHNGQ